MAINEPVVSNYYGNQPVFAERKMAKFAVTIPAGSAYSDTFNFVNLRSFAVLVPATFTGNKISFVASYEDTEDETEMSDCYTGHGGEIVVDVVGGAWVCPKDEDLHGLHNLRYLKVRAGVGVTPSLQAETVTLYFVCLG
jgi:hypothetical protein